VTSAHIFFIPGMIMIGMFLGFVLGARATRNQIELQRRRDEDREAARAARAAKRAEAVDTKPVGNDEPAPKKAEKKKAK
jgi:hypothetical protein